MNRFTTIIFLCLVLNYYVVFCKNDKCHTCKVIDKSIMDRRAEAKEPQNLDIEIKDDNIKAGIQQVISKIRPQWNTASLEYKEFKNGITNKLYGVWDAKVVKDSSMVLVRIYGKNTGKIIDRAEEIRNIKVLYNEGYGPLLYAIFKNGLAYEFVSGKILNNELVKSEKVYPQIAAMMALTHKIKLSDDIPKKPFIWKKMQQFIDFIPDKYSDPQKQAQYQNNTMKKADIVKELKELSTALSNIGSPVMFCHNDLLLANIIYNDEKSLVTFIDFEYSNYNYEAFDLGNHFAEHAGVDDVDFARLPNDDFMRKFIVKYLETYHGTQKTPYTCSPGKVDKYEVEKLLVQSKKFILAAHLFWGAWAYAQANNSLIKFDYLGYGEIKLAEYLRMKKQYLSIPYPPKKN